MASAADVLSRSRCIKITVGFVGGVNGVSDRCIQSNET